MARLNHKSRIIPSLSMLLSLRDSPQARERERERERESTSAQPEEALLPLLSPRGPFFKKSARTLRPDVPHSPTSRCMLHASNNLSLYFIVSILTHIILKPHFLLYACDIYSYSASLDNTWGDVEPLDHSIHTGWFGTP